MLDKELCRLLNVDKFIEYIVNKMEAIEETLRVTKQLPEYYSQMSESLKSDYEFLKNARDLYVEFLNEQKKEQEKKDIREEIKENMKDYYQCVYDTMLAREDFLRRHHLANIRRDIR